LQTLRRSEAFQILTRNAGAQRARAERFIEHQYLTRFGAVITDHFPTLFSLEDDQGCVLAGLGIRNAAQEPLFLEHYFDEPIERVISRLIGVSPSRADILEIGNLASIGRTASARLIAASSLHLEAGRCRYAVITATAELRRMLGSFGYTWRRLGPAQPWRLPGFGRSWGHYYEQSPQIVVGEVRQRSERMQSYASRIEMKS